MKNKTKNTDSILHHKLAKEYGDLLKESDHPIYQDEHGVVRWVPTKIGEWLGDNIDLNALSIAHQRGLIPLDQYKEFYRNMGYSLCGFSDLFRNWKASFR